MLGAFLLSHGRWAQEKSNFARLMGQMGEDVSWVDDSDSDDGPIYPSP